MNRHGATFLAVCRMRTVQDVEDGCWSQVIAIDALPLSKYLGSDKKHTRDREDNSGMRPLPRQVRYHPGLYAKPCQYKFLDLNDKAALKTPKGAYKGSKRKNGAAVATTGGNGAPVGVGAAVSYPLSRDYRPPSSSSEGSRQRPKSKGEKKRMRFETYEGPSSPSSCESTLSYSSVPCRRMGDSRSGSSTTGSTTSVSPLPLDLWHQHVEQRKGCGQDMWRGREDIPTSGLLSDDVRADMLSQLRRSSSIPYTDLASSAASISPPPDYRMLVSPSGGGGGGGDYSRFPSLYPYRALGSSPSPNGASSFPLQPQEPRVPPQPRFYSQRQYSMDQLPMSMLEQQQQQTLQAPPFYMRDPYWSSSSTSSLPQRAAQPSYPPLPSRDYAPLYPPAFLSSSSSSPSYPPWATPATPLSSWQVPPAAAAPPMLPTHSSYSMMPSGPSSSFSRIGRAGGSYPYRAPAGHPLMGTGEFNPPSIIHPSSHIYSTILANGGRGGEDEPWLSQLLEHYGERPT